MAELEALISVYPADRDAHRLLIGLYGHDDRFQREDEERRLLHDSSGQPDR